MRPEFYTCPRARASHSNVGSVCVFACVFYVRFVTGTAPRQLVIQCCSLRRRGGGGGFFFFAMLARCGAVVVIWQKIARSLKIKLSAAVCAFVLMLRWCEEWLADGNEFSREVRIHWNFVILLCTRELLRIYVCESSAALFLRGLNENGGDFVLILPGKRT